MASIVDKFVFALMLDAKGFKEGAETAKSALVSIKNAFLKTYSLVGGFDLFKNMLYTYTDVSKSIDDFSLVTGENIYQLQAWQKAIQDTGGDINGLQGTIRKFTDMQVQLKRYGTASGIEEFLRVGIDPRGKSAFQILQQVGKLLSTVKDNARAFNIARNLGIDESTFIMLRRYGENFDKIIKSNERYAFINRSAIAQTREYNRIVSHFKTSWLQLSQSIMREVLPVLEYKLFPIIEKTTNYLLNDALPALENDVIPVIKEIGSFIKFTAEFYGEKAGELAGKIEQGNNLTQAQYNAGVRAKEAGLSFSEVKKMSDYLKDIKDAQHYTMAANAYIDIKVNANNSDGKYIGQEIAKSLTPAAEQLRQQLGGMQR